MAPQLLFHQPVATEEAFRDIEQIHENLYEHPGLGKCRDAGEDMHCEWIDPPSEACGNGSRCLNRLTQVECLAGTCRCGAYCSNQRFQRRKYADVEVIKTERKGFGLRACSTIDKNAFIREYVGDVIGVGSLTERMRRYAGEGLKSFYLMMLQKNEFIDATKRGGLGRFINHSCVPNCYVTSWSVGLHVRMGIFAKRVIEAGEELSFNYNVDRYGHEEQPCYCAEPNCVGFIGGKTQTDIRMMDDVYPEVFGLTDEERLVLKKNGGGKMVDMYRVTGTVKPISNSCMNEVCQALRQLPSRIVLIRLLKRINMTADDPTSLRMFLRLRGMSLLTAALHDNDEDQEVTMLVLQCLSIMPLINDGKVEDSGARELVRACMVSCEGARFFAQKLLDDWDQLPFRHRIAKRVMAESFKSAMVYDPSGTPPKKKQKLYPPQSATKSNPPVTRDKYKTHTGPLSKHPCEPATTVGNQQSDYSALLRRLRSARVKFTDGTPTTNEDNQSTAKAKTSTTIPEKAQFEAGSKEGRLHLLVVHAVKSHCRKYSAELGANLFNNYANEISKEVSRKEGNSSWFKNGRVDSLPDKMVAKIQKFSDDYYVKEVYRLKKARGRN